MVKILTILLQQEEHLWTFHTEKLRVVMTFIRLASKSAYTMYYIFLQMLHDFLQVLFLFTNDPNAQRFATTL